MYCLYLAIKHACTTKKILELFITFKMTLPDEQEENMQEQAVHAYPTWGTLSPMSEILFSSCFAHVLLCSACILAKIHALGECMYHICSLCTFISYKQYNCGTCLVHA